MTIAKQKNSMRRRPISITGMWIAVFILPGKEYKTGRSDFASAFKVATNQPQKAQMLLNDTFMSNLLYLQSLTERKIALTVKNGWIYILMPNKKSVLR